MVPLTSESVLNVSFKALVDSGSTNCFIESTFVRNHNLTPFRVPNIPLKLFDGTTNSVILLSSLAKNSISKMTKGRCDDPK